MKSLMDQEGLPYGERKMSYNSRLAQELGKWAEGKPDGDRIHDALFRAYFIENFNIAKPEVLLKLVEEVGLPISEANEVLESRLFKDEVDADWKRCWELGVTVEPSRSIQKNRQGRDSPDGIRLRGRLFRRGKAHRDRGDRSEVRVASA